MRAREFLRLIEDDLTTLKHKVIKSIETTDDATLLDKIYSSLNRTNISQRIGAALNQNDSDIKKYIDEIVEVIVNTPGRYEDKLLFAEGLDKGYVNIKEMLSGKRVHFEDLLATNKTGVPISFIVSVFNGLKLVGANESKGPGEFALAALSPDISIFGAGDLKIGNQNIEVKATAGKERSGGGKLGSTGFLQHHRVPDIINSYMPEGLKVDPSMTLGLSTFSQLLKKANLDPETLIQFATELFDYIFEGKDWADTSPLINAMVAGNDLEKPYTMAAYSAYRGRPDNTKFDGVMLMSFPLQELKYYDDPEKMYDDLYAPGVSLISSNKEFASRNILPSVSLRPEKVEKIEKINAKGKELQEIENWAGDYATYMIKLNKNRTPGLADEIKDFIMYLYNKNKLNSATIKNLNPLIYKHFPQLKKTTSDAETPVVNAKPTEQPPIEQTPAEVPASIQNQTRTLGNKIPMGST
jgi:hypothetical protein